MSSLYLIDGHAQFFRAYHAIRPGLRSPVTDEPTNMTFGFVGVLLKLLREQAPDYLAVVVDASGDQGTFRSQIYPQYKANRSPPPDDLEPQVERCIQFLKSLQIPVLAVEGVEADDTIATVVRRCRQSHPDMDVRIVSRDKDLGQLVDERVKLFDPQTDTELGVEQLFESKGIRPDQVVDMLALMGDTVDNVPGVKGVGIKTAGKLIGKYGSLAALLQNIHQEKNKTGEAIAAQAGILPLSLSLVKLKDDVAVEFDLESARVDLKSVHPEAPLEMIRQLGFNRHFEELRRMMGQSSSAVASPPEPAPVRRTAPETSTTAVDGFDLFHPAPESVDVPAVTGEALVRFQSGAYQMLTTRQQVEGFLSQARTACGSGALLAFDTETTGLNPVSADLCGVSMSFQADHGVYIPVRSPDPGGHLNQAQVVELITPILEDPAVGKTAHNAKFDLIVLRAAGINVKGLVGDSMVASYVLDATRGTHKMDALSEALLGHRCIPIVQLIGSGTHQRTFAQVPLEVAAPYAAEDADVAWRLERVLVPQLEAAGLSRLYRDVELPLVPVLAELEWNGIRVDAPELERQRRALELEIEKLRVRIAEISPRPFNLDSPKQLAEILFHGPEDSPPGLGIKVVKKTRTGASTDVEVLEKLALDPLVTSEIPSRILEYRQLTKLVGTYLVALRQAIDPTTGRIHASFHQTVTATGRLSSSDPNLQNIPIRSAMGREVRRAFVADEGNVIYSADYSQIELRMLAHLSGDQALAEAFRTGLDIHTAVAAEVYGISPQEVTPEQRSGAKMVNFGIVYGITAFGLARRLGAGTSNERARQIIQGYKRRFASIDAFLAQCVQHARDHGFVQTILGRRRPIPQIQSKNPTERAFGERIAINTVVQGSAADLIKLAMLRIYADLPATVPTARMLLQIHDELVFEVPQAHVEVLDTFVRAAMENAMTLSVPLKAESGWASNWFDA